MTAAFYRVRPRRLNRGGQRAKLLTQILTSEVNRTGNAAARLGRARADHRGRSSGPPYEQRLARLRKLPGLAALTFAGERQQHRGHGILVLDQHEPCQLLGSEEQLAENALVNGQAQCQDARSVLPEE